MRESQYLKQVKVNLKIEFLLKVELCSNICISFYISIYKYSAQFKNEKKRKILQRLICMLFNNVNMHEFWISNILKQIFLVQMILSRKKDTRKRKRNFSFHFCSTSYFLWTKKDRKRISYSNLKNVQQFNKIQKGRKKNHTLMQFISINGN
jgi:hypothetical protein